jgi:aspartate 1-decarboxylase
MRQRVHLIPSTRVIRLTMLRTMLQAKLHRVRVTQADLDYEGSCGIDEALLDAAGLREYQYIELYNVNNGERFSTYIIKAARGSGAISLNGAAARKAMVGDLLIICAYTAYSDVELERYEPVVVLVDEHNVPRLKPSLRAAS